MPTLRLRFDFDQGQIGARQVALLEQIEELGSITAAGRATGVSYRHAWALIAELSRLFGKPAVETRHGGKSGGGAALTLLGRTIVVCYRDAERASRQASVMHLDALQAEILKR